MDADLGPTSERAYGSYPRGEIGDAFRRRVYLVAIERDVMPPVCVGNTVLQRMRVTLAPPRVSPERAAEAALVAARSTAAPARAVRGEILRDEHGRLYEKVGHFVRRLGPIEASSDGELVELPRSEDTGAAAAAEPSRAPEPSRPVEPSRAAEPPRAAEPSRRLFRDPGQWRVLRWGEFKTVLARHIAHPERLRDDHRLPCYVQVIEAGARQSVTQLAQGLFGNPETARDLMLLSRSAAQRLDITAVLPPPRDNREAPRERGVVLPGDRLFLLRPAVDPTADSTASTERKQRIPDSFTNQAFPRTRDEVLADMREYPSLGRRFSQWAASLFARTAFSRWQRSLSGKRPDDQLWASQPPTALLADARVREWATTTLEGAGYEPAVMLREWEIYWRRKALL